MSIVSRRSPGHRGSRCLAAGAWPGLFIVCIAFVGTVSLTLPASAAVPDRINFQGILETDGALFTGNADLSFAIYADSSGGTPVWSRAARTTEVRDGLYSVPLGPFAGGFVHDPAWLEVSVNGVPLQPRYRLESVPFALRAAEADRVAENAVDGASVRHGSLTAAHLSTDIVSTINGISNDGGNIDLVAGTNVAITPNNTDKTITINALIDGAITRVEAGGGLVGSDPTSPTVTLRVGAGTGVAVAEDAVSVDAAAIAGEGLRAVAPAQLGVQAGDGLQIARGSLELAPSYLSGSAFDSRFVNEGQAGAVTTEMIAPNIVSSISGVTNDGGNIELAAGPNVVITPDPQGHRVTISALEGGYLAEVHSDGGLVVSEGPGPRATISVGAGDGILVNSSAIAVDAAALAGSGLRTDESNNLEVNAGSGLQVADGQVQVDPQLVDGSAHDARFVNELQEQSISTAMIIPDVVSSLSGVTNDGGDIDLLPGHGMTIAPSDATNSITFTVNTEAFAGPGLIADADHNLMVNPGVGLEVSSWGALQLTLPYRHGAAYDDRFINVDEENSISADMIVPNIVSSIDGVVNDAGSIDFVEGDGVTIAPSDAQNTITFGLTEAYSSGSAYDDRFVNEEGPGTIPVGGIIMWSGSVGSIPAGWALCDGSTVNGHVTPDLRGRFVLAAGAGAGLTPRTVDQTGGAETHTLTTNEMPTHDHGVTDAGHGHGVTDAGHSHGVTDPGHGHDVKSGPTAVAGVPAATGTFLPSTPGVTTESATTGISINSSTTGISINSSTTGISINNSGSGHAHNNMPPYHVLAYIMRVQ